MFKVAVVSSCLISGRSLGPWPFRNGGISARERDLGKEFPGSCCGLFMSLYRPHFIHPLHLRTCCSFLLKCLSPSLHGRILPFLQNCLLHGDPWDFLPTSGACLSSLPVLIIVGLPFPACALADGPVPFNIWLPRAFGQGQDISWCQGQGQV